MQTTTWVWGLYPQNFVKYMLFSNISITPLIYKLSNVPLTT